MTKQYHLRVLDKPTSYNPKPTLKFRRKIPVNIHLKDKHTKRVVGWLSSCNLLYIHSGFSSDVVLGLEGR
jgi:hypothetical protein